MSCGVASSSVKKPRSLAFMCGRYASFMAPNEIQLAFDLDALGEETEGLAPSWNVAPTQDIAIVLERLAESDQQVSRELHMARWGLVPPWAKEPGAGPVMFNARIETVAEKRTFAPSLKKRRCIVPANGYFEWEKTSSGKVPHYIHYAAGGPLAFAGLYGWWKAPDGSWLLSATIITRSAEGPMSRIHDRIPVILPRESYDQWLDPHLDDPEAARSIIDVPSPELVADIVGKNVGNVRNNSPENIKPVSEETAD